MGRMPVLFSLCALIALILAATSPADCDRSMYLGVCQELVNTARSYEARSTYHQNIARSIQMQIQNLAKMPKNQGTMMAMENLFSQYDQNRALENKFRALFRKANEEADRCMKSAE